MKNKLLEIQQRLLEIQYIRLEDLSSAKVPIDTAKCDGIQLVDNALFLEEQIFNELHRANSQNQRQSGTAWVLSFPRISRVEGGKTNLCPLFSLDVIEIFKGGYQAEGWNLERFEMAEAGENLAAFLNLDDDQLERLNVKDGLKRFLEVTFGFSFNSLEDWMQRVSLPQYPNIIRQPYLSSSLPKAAINRGSTNYARNQSTDF